MKLTTNKKYLQIINNETIILYQFMSSNRNAIKYKHVLNQNQMKILR